MARFTCGFEVEARDRIASGDDAIVGPAWFGDQHVFVARGLRLDDVARRGGSDFLVRREQYRDRQRRRDRGARQLPDRFQRQVIAALHVEDAGSEAFIAVAAPRQFFQGADRVNGIEVARDQNARLALLRMRKTRADATAEPLPPGDPFDRSTHYSHFARREIEHAVHGINVPGRAFAFHPGAQALQHGLGIERKVGKVHCNSLNRLWGGIVCRCERVGARRFRGWIGDDFVKSNLRASSGLFAMLQ